MSRWWPTWGEDVEAHGGRVALPGARASVADDLGQPTFEEFLDGILLGRDVDAGRLVAVEGLELVGNLFARLPVDDFAAALAIDDAQVDSGTPQPITALVEAALSMSSSAYHYLILYRVK